MSMKTNFRGPLYISPVVLSYSLSRGYWSTLEISESAIRDAFLLLFLAYSEVAYAAGSKKNTEHEMVQFFRYH